MPVSERTGLSVEGEFNRLNISYRLCHKALVETNNDHICVCKRPVYWHNHREKCVGSEKDWTIEHNTTPYVNPAHGQLKNGSMFAQLAIDTPIEKVEKILFGIWNIKRPRLIMSILGGAKYFVLSDRLESNFINGMIDVAVNSDACIITNGYNTGIVQLVGQAITKMKLTNQGTDLAAVGVCKWGSVLTSLQKQVPDSNEHVLKRIDDSIGEKTKETKERKPSGESDLELNHTHFLMLDDGTWRNYDTKDYRTRLCAYLGNHDAENGKPIPVVTLVVEGGIETINNIYYDLHEGIPVVIIDGTGRAADLFKQWLLYTSEFDHHEDRYNDPYEIENFILTSVEPFPPITTRSNVAAAGERGGYTRIDYNLNSSKKKLGLIFQKYKDQLDKDIKALLFSENSSEKSTLKGSPKVDKETMKKTPEQVLNYMMYCLQPAVRSALSVFSLDTDSNLSETIFRAICRARQKHMDCREKEKKTEDDRSRLRSKPPATTKDREIQDGARETLQKKDRNVQRSELLALAMDWNCIDVARELILKNSLSNIINPEEAFCQALKKNLPTFVHEFLKLGFDPAQAFFIRNRDQYSEFIDILYQNSTKKDEQNTELDSVAERTSEKRVRYVDDVSHLNRIIRTLVGDFMHRLYFATRQEEEQHRLKNALNRRKPTHHKIVSQEESGGDRNQEEQQVISRRDVILRDLFLWAILMNYIEMAKVFLAHMKYRICPALIATKILKAYHEIALHGKLKEEYLQSAKYFEQYAIDCITLCEKNDPDEACKLVLQENELYGYVTCLQIASLAEDKSFLATPCCVQAMNNTWYDKFYPDQSRKQDVLAMTVGFFTLGLFGPPLIRYRQDESVKGIPPEPQLRNNGITYCDQYRLLQPPYSQQPLINKYLHQLVQFHQSPRMKYWYHCLFYCFFLLLFSYVLLFRFHIPRSQAPSIDWTEILLIILVSFMLIEEIHHFVNQESVTFLGRCYDYVSNLFKMMNLIGFILFYVGLILRFQNAANDVDFTAARVVMAIDLDIWWLRSLSFIIVIPYLGPHLVAIIKMLKDLLFFICIIAIVMIGYGVASRSMVYYPNPDIFNTGNVTTAFDGRSIFRQVFYPVYYLMYGDMGNERIDLDQYPDAGWSIATHVLLAFHMLFVNILLTNLLIAMFSKRFDQVYEETKSIWHSQQYLFTREYFARSPGFPPISWAFDIYFLVRRFVFFIKSFCSTIKEDRRKKQYKMIPKTIQQIKKWYQFEGASTYEYAHAQVKQSFEAEMKSKTSTDRVDGVKAEQWITGGDSSESTSILKEIQDDLVIIKEYMKDRANNSKT